MAGFLPSLTKEVDYTSKSFGLPADKAFSVWFGKMALDLEDQEAFEAVRAYGANDKTIDLFWVDEVNERVVIGQGKFSPEGKHHPKVKDLESLLGCTDWLVSPEALKTEGKPELVDAATDYVEAVEKGFSVELWFFYCGGRDENIDKRVRVFNINPENEAQRRAARHFDLGLIQNMYDESRGGSRRIPEATIIPEPEKLFEVKGVFGRGLVLTVPGRQLVDLYETHGDRLFDRDVRLFLGTRKGSVNAGILGTIGDPKERGNFWAYNNGITVVCDSYDEDEKDGTIRLKNFSIVNGCQTTVALAREAENVTDKVKVMVRVISPPEEIIDSIIRFTNSQNQIPAWVISAQDKTQRRLQKAFEDLKDPIYYVLRPGDLAALKPERRTKFRVGATAKIRRASHDLLAQYLASFKGRPVVAYKNKAFLFTKLKDEVFPMDLRVEEALFVWRAGQIVEEKVREGIQKAVGDGREQEVLALKRGGRFYVLAVLGQIAHLRNGPDFMRSITEERITSRSAGRRIGKYAEYSMSLYLQALSDLLQLTNKDMPVLIREQDFFARVAERAANTYRMMSVNKDWLKGALPGLF